MTPMSRHTDRLPLALLWLGAAGFASLLFLTEKPWNPDTLSKCIVNLHAPGSVAFRMGDFLALFFWPAAAFNLFLTLSLIGTFPRWSSRREIAPINLAAEAPPGDPLQASPGWTKKNSVLFLSASLVSMALAAWMAYPRLSQSFWGDEAYTMSENLHGHFKRSASIQPGVTPLVPYFRLLQWKDALWSYPNTNNHFLFTILGKTSLRLWQEFSGAQSWRFREEVVRGPPFVAGLLAIPCWMLFLRRLGFASAAACLGLFLAIHPWFLRYISEARGYAFVLLFLPLNLIIVGKAIGTGRWRWWLLHALSQFLLLYSWPGIAAHVAGVNLGLAVLILLSRKDPSERRLQFTRWAAANLFTLMVLIQLIAPCVPQVLGFIRDEWYRVPIGLSWSKDTFGLLFLGTNWVTRDPPELENPISITLEKLADASPLLLPLGLGFLILCALAGTLRWWRTGHWHRFLLLVFLLPPLTFYGYAFVRQKFLFSWYFVYLVPPLLCLVLAGGTAITLILPRNHGATRPLIRFLPTIAICLALFWLHLTLTAPKRRALREHPLEPQRESVLLTRPTLDPNDPLQLQALTAHVHFPADVYDPYGYRVTKASADSDAEPGLTRLMRWSDQAGLPLFINVGYPVRARSKLPDIMRLIDNPEMFSKLQDVPGLEPHLNRAIYRYLGGVFPSAGGSAGK